MDDLDLLLAAAARCARGAESAARPMPAGAAPAPERRALRVAIGVTGASGAIFALDFARRCPGRKYLVASRWARAILQSELGEREEVFDPFVHARFADTDLAAPLASGSNPLDAFVIVPCTVSTACKIAAGIGDTLITRTAQVTLKEKRRLVLAVRETPLSGIALEALARLSREGAVVFPLSPPWYGNPLNLDELVSATTDRLLEQIGIETPGGWRGEELE
jgi:polyprenyl P-hydroxybenzoate/phenylacrylic acid decarboxylase-like protein